MKEKIETAWKNLQYKIRSVFRKAYGPDSLSKFLVWTAFILSILNALFIRNAIITILTDVLFITALFRMLSSNHVKRSIENDKFLTISEYPRRLWKAMRMNLTDRQYHYAVCRKCHQISRVPKGHGKVTVTCPKCHEKYQVSSGRQS